MRGTLGSAPPGDSPNLQWPSFPAPVEINRCSCAPAERVWLFPECGLPQDKLEDVLSDSAL